MQPHPQPAPQPGAPAAAPSAQPPALPPGTILLDRYLIQGYINGGGFGHIYKALDNALGYRRAIKEAFYQDPQTRQQFHLEAEFLINVRHPNLVAGYAVFEQGGRLYLVMDYVDGHTLEEIAIHHIRQTSQPLSEAQILDWVLPVCGALHALHSSPRPVIHRDVKPANIKVTRQGVPVLIDLGLAKLYAQGMTTIGAALAFTPGYAPPEQYRATGATDARTDVYGMGATLFYLLTGYQPTEAPARLGSLTVPPLRQLNPAISPLTETAVLRAMELLPEHRQQSALELERDLRAARAALERAAHQQVWSPGAAPDLSCRTCGAANPAAARHCILCGAPLARPDGEQADATGVEWLFARQGDRGEQGEQAEEPEQARQTPTPTPRLDQQPREEPRAETRPAPWDQAAPAPEAGPADAPKAAREPVPGDAPVAVTRDLGQDGGADAAAVERAEAEGSSPEAGNGAEADEVERGPALVGESGPDSVPDQPAIAMPPLRRGPAPAAKPLGPSDPLGAPAAAHAQPAGQRPLPPRVAPRVPGGQPRLPVAAGQQRAAMVATRMPAAVLALAVPSLRRWHAETLRAAAPLDEAEVRLGLAGVMSLVLAVCTLLAIRTPLALALALPALALGHWCQRAASQRALPEARWLATAGLAISYVWLGLYIAGWLVVALHHWL